MDQWADDDDEEEAWKDLLQAKVNQLELVIQSRRSPSTTDSASTTAVTQLHVTPAADARIALSGATHIAALRGPDTRPATRGQLLRAADVHHRLGTASAAGATVSPSVRSI